jgi:2-polyprenyl-3-methyl-5-hydroxy-6-metoxy-1,4-benzoquinol methylase
VKNQHVYLEVKDHSVSGERFQLLYDIDLDMLITSPQPSLEKLPDYYKSEDYISHTNTKRNLFESIYHIVRKKAIKRKLKLINSFSNDSKNLLDVGCGTGDFLQRASLKNWTVSGIEPNEKAREIANQKTQNAVYKAEALLKFKQQSFDVITLWHVLEHLPNLDEHLSIFKSLLKANGTLIIAVPNFKSYDAVHYKNFWAAYDAPRHLWHFSQTSISKLAFKENMKVIKTLPMKYDAFYVSLLSEKNRFGKMNLLKALWTGLLSNMKAKKSSEYSSIIYCIKNN